MEQLFYSAFDSFGHQTSDNRFLNWNGTTSCKPDEYTVLDGNDLKTELRQLVQSHKKLRVLGRALNFNNITYSQDHLVSFEKCTRILSMMTLEEVIPGTTISKSEMRVQPGIMGRDLANAIDVLGYGLPNMANFLHQTLGGVINSGSHGTLGKEDRGGYLSMITEIRMVDGNGDDLVLRKDDGSMEYAVGLGCLGLIYEVTMVLDVEQYTLEQKTEWIPRRTLTAEMVESDIASNYLVMYKTLPALDQVERFTFNKVESGEENHASILAKNALDYQLLPRVLISAVDLLNQFNLNSSEVIGHVNTVATQTRPPGSLISKSHHIVPDASAMPEHVQTEWAIRIEDIETVLKEIKRSARTTESIKLSEVHIRFSARSGVLLHPAFERRVAWVDFNTLGIDAGTFDRHDRFIEILKKYDARPHWAKQHFQNAGYIETVYSTEVVDRFKAFREQHDRTNVLLSPYIQAMFSIYENSETFMNSKYGLTQVKRVVGTDPRRCVVLVPGFSIAYQDIFEPFASELEGVTVVTYNHQGRGESTSSTVYAYDRAMFVDILDQIIRTYCSEANEVTLLGVSMGGAIVGDFMTLRGKEDARIKQLVLCAPFGLCGVPVKDKLSFHLAAALPQMAYETLSFAKIADGYRIETASYTDANVAHIERYLGKHGSATYHGTVKGYMNADHFHQMWINVNELGLPKTMIYGTNDSVVPYRAEGALVDGEYHLIEGEGHNLIKSNEEALRIVKKLLLPTIFGA